MAICPDVNSNFLQAGVNCVASSGGFNTNTPSIYNTIALFIDVILGLTGLTFLVLLIYAGILYLVDLGDAEKVKKAKDMMRDAIIGIVLIIASYAVVTYVFSLLGQAVKTTP